MSPEAVNFHINRACDAHCTFCFAVFPDVRGTLAPDDALSIINALAEAGVSKLNFAGGEPTLHPHLGCYLRHAKSRGLVTSLVTNGSRLEPLLASHGAALDWVGLSVDTGDEDVQAALGRGRGDHVARAVRLAARCREAGVRVKLNTVVTSLNVSHDLSALVREMRPERWKVFQVLRVEGQNDGRVEPLLITAADFASFVARHAHLADEGYAPVVEDNDAMTDSYAMIDPRGRFFGNTAGIQRYSRPVLEVGVEAALAEVGFRHTKLLARGGRYEW